MNYYKHHLGDYDGATAHLSWDEDMAYTRLLRAYYRREGAIPASEVYRLVRASSKAQRAAVDSVLSEFFQQNGDGWHNKRADEEITMYQAQADTNRRIARERTVKRTVNEPSNDSLTNRPPNQEPEPITKNQGKKSARARATPFPESFEISERVKTWAQQKGYRLDGYLEFFTGRMKANGKTYVDWDEAFMNCIREDWPELRKRGNGQDHPEVVNCSKCGGSLAGGWTNSSDGRLCNPCWEAR